MNLIINSCEIKFKRNLTKTLVNAKELNIEGSIQSLIDLLKLKNSYSDDFLKQCLNISLKINGDYKTIFDYVEKCQENNFNENVFFEFLKWREKNGSISNTNEYYSLQYGSRGSEIKKHILDKKLLPYDIEYWQNKGFSLNDSIIQIEKYKKNKATNFEKFIERHGEEKGKQMFEKFQNTSKHTKASFIEKYGNEEGEIKYREYLKMKDSSSYDWALKKANGNEELAKKILKEKTKKCTINYDWALKKANGNEELAAKIYKDRYDKSIINYDWALKKANGNEELATKMYNDLIDKRCRNIKFVSKESIIFFKKIISEFDFLKNEQIMMGIDGIMNEFYLYDRERNRRYFYDFHIPSKKIIIEYNGEKFHPNYEKYSFEELKNQKFFMIKNEEELKQKITHDQRKIEFAMKTNDCLLLWTEDGEDFNILKTKKFLKKHYEN